MLSHWKQKSSDWSLLGHCDPSGYRSLGAWALSTPFWLSWRDRQPTGSAFSSSPVAFGPERSSGTSLNSSTQPASKASIQVGNDRTLESTSTQTDASSRLSWSTQWKCPGSGSSTKTEMCRR